MIPFANAQKKGKGYQISVGQKKPTIMILPSDNWCEMRYHEAHYFIDKQITKVYEPNKEVKEPLNENHMNMILAIKTRKLRLSHFF